MKNVSDVIVVGGGPCGSFAALNLRKFGVDVQVFEEHREIGVPSHCAGHLSLAGLQKLGLWPLPSKIVENMFHGANFYSPKGNVFAVRFSSHVTCVVNRPLFDRWIAEKAAGAGATYHLGSYAESLLIEDGFVTGVEVKRESTIHRSLARVVIDAEGIPSRLLKKMGVAGLHRQFVVNGVEGEAENVKDMEPDVVEVFLGNEYAPGFYAWLIPTHEKEAKIGLATKTGNPRDFLHRFMQKHPVASEKLNKATLRKVQFHPLPLGGPIAKNVANGLLAVGDAASHVKPTTGGGVIWGLNAAQIAADITSEALRRNDVSSRFLSMYRAQCDRVFGFDAKIMLRIRKMLNAMSDERLDDLIRACSRMGLNEAFETVDDVDFQGRALLKLWRSPRVLAVLSYFMLAYLSSH